MTRIASFLKLTRRRRALLAEASVLLTGASLAIALLPFRRVIKLSRRAGSRAIDPAIIADACWAVERAARALPWRAVCFQQALALHWLLLRRGVATELHYGVGYDDARDLKAHVWLGQGDRVLIGGSDPAGMRHIATFPQG